MPVLDPTVVPPVLGAGPHRVLLADVPGQDQYDARGEELRHLASMLIGLQASWIGRVPELEALGVPDNRAGAAVPRIHSVVDRNRHELDDETRRALDVLVEGLPERFAALAACGIPDTLVHGDFHPGNVRGTAGRLPHPRLGRLRHRSPHARPEGFRRVLRSARPAGCGQHLGKRVVAPGARLRSPTRGRAGEATGSALRSGRLPEVPGQHRDDRTSLPRGGSGEPHSGRRPPWLPHRPWTDVRRPITGPCGSRRPSWDVRWSLVGLVGLAGTADLRPDPRSTCGPASRSGARRAGDDSGQVQPIRDTSDRVGTRPAEPRTTSSGASSISDAGGGGATDQVEQRAAGGRGHLQRRLAHGRERRVGELDEHRVVGADDRQVAGAPRARAAGRPGARRGPSRPTRRRCR